MRYGLAVDLGEVDYTMRVPSSHVYPVFDDGSPKHDMHGWCWCQPLVEEPLTGGRIYIHRRTLDSPHREIDA